MMDNKTIAILLLMPITWFAFKYLIPDGALGYIKAGRDETGRWHIWWDRP